MSTSIVTHKNEINVSEFLVVQESIPFSRSTVIPFSIDICSYHQTSAANLGARRCKGRQMQTTTFLTNRSVFHNTLGTVTFETSALKAALSSQDS
ncbi:hypothetical protein TNIN_234771 [Trichonephila inaurata madagascariensis]|uniref:Uncharacterized protein n=1 Tax=Trichonephila inaurata madagascariensis TaxID=2747483 RepID=A0A8X6I9M7_9ARAC|nr:hypothetical protein TNIN_234771 [Trichonephila inaurata madagascariensis]